jgi:uncharacterized membrane protein YbhN (UPF0104 family)
VTVLGRKAWLRALSWVVVATLAIFAIASIVSKWDGLRGSFALVDWGASPPAMALSAVLLAIALAINPAGWVLISRELGARSRLKAMIAAWFASQLGRYAPGKIWLFAGRIGYLKSEGLSLARSTAASAWELLCSFAAAGLVACPAMLLAGGLPVPEGARAAIVVAAGSILLLPLLHPVQRLAFRLRGSGDYIAVRFPVTAKAGAIYALIWVLRGLSLWLWLVGLGIPSNGLQACMAAAPLAWLAGYIVIVVPGGIGIREAVTGALVAAPGLVGPVIAAALGQTILMAVLELALAFIFMRLASRTGRNGEPDASNPQG